MLKVYDSNVITSRNHPKWYFFKCNNIQFTMFIFDMLAEEFSRIFGVECIENEECLVFNDSEADCPMLITNCTPVGIRLSQKSLGCWAQTIYQLSHEMCHYVCRQYKENKAYTLSWYEELVSEAVSLYALSYASNNWNRCELYSQNPAYGRFIKEYLDNEIKRANEGTKSFSQCNSLEALARYEQECESDRMGHIKERNALFEILLMRPSDLNILCNYEPFLKDDKLTFDFNHWYTLHPTESIRFFRDIQPVKC